jgi:hypothetical protein
VKATGKFGLRGIGAVLSAALLALEPVAAYDAPLDPSAVREAYFLGRRSDQTREKFLETYKKRLPLPEKGPYVSEIELLTPYAQVVDVARQHTAGYSAQQAAEDYKKRGDIIQVHVRIELTPTYGQIEPSANSKDPRAGKGITLRREDFWKGFECRLTQGDKAIESYDTYGEPIFVRSSTASGGLTGAQV